MTEVENENTDAQAKLWGFKIISDEMQSDELTVNSYFSDQFKLYL